MKTFYPRQHAVRVVLLTLALAFNSASKAETVLDIAPLAVSDFVKNSLNQQPRLLAAQADIAASSANLQAAKQAIYNPELELAYENSSANTKTIGISQTLDWGDQQGSRTDLAVAELSVIKTNYTIAVQNFATSLLTGLAQNQTAKQLEQLSSEALNLMQQFKRIAEQRHQAGDLNQVDLNLAQLAYSQALMEHASSLSRVTEVHEQLRSIVGMLPEQLPVLPEQLSEPVLQDNLDSFLLELPAIRSKMAEVQSNRQQIALRKSQQAWNPTIGVTAGTEGSDNLIGLNLSIPLNIRNNFSAEVDVAYQQLIASEQRAQQDYRNIRANIAATTVRYQNLLSAWDSWRQNSRDSVSQQLILINQLWQAGDISASDYLLQVKQALEIQATGFELRNELWQTAFEWMRLTASVDKWLNINLQEIN